MKIKTQTVSVHVLGVHRSRTGIEKPDDLIHEYSTNLVSFLLEAGVSLDVDEKTLKELVSDLTEYICLL
jgi:hypothetical protein